MAVTSDIIRGAAHELRGEPSHSLCALSQADIVSLISQWAAKLQTPGSYYLAQCQALNTPFSWEMTAVSFAALLKSLTPAELWQLIDAEGVRDAHGQALMGHIIAANTPLLSWVSILRALLMRSASLVKLPSGPAGEWGELFLASLHDTAPILAESVRLLTWPGGTAALDAALCQSVDLVMAHGSDPTLHSLQALTRTSTPFVGYGHRVSFGLVRHGFGTNSIAEGFAKDVLIYDQGGCLSPQTLFVEGGWHETLEFAERLAVAFSKIAPRYPLPYRSPEAAGIVRETRMLARMEQGTRLWENPALRWTVIARLVSAFVPSPTFGLLTVQPLASLAALPEAVQRVRGKLQGVAVAGGSSGLSELGLSHICAPGELQAPPFSWRQDSQNLLRPLLRA